MKLEPAWFFGIHFPFRAMCMLLTLGYFRAEKIHCAYISAIQCSQLSCQQKLNIFQFVHQTTWMKTLLDYHFDDFFFFFNNFPYQNTTILCTFFWMIFNKLFFHEVKSKPQSLHIFGSFLCVSRCCPILVFLTIFKQP